MKYRLLSLIVILLLGCNNDEPQINSSNNTTNSSTGSISYSVPLESLSMLALGDSYTIGASVNKEDRWNEQLKHQLERKGYQIGDIKYIAQTGWTTTRLLSAIERENIQQEYDIVTLLIGVNNQFQGINMDVFEEEFNELLDLAIDFADGNADKVIVLSIPDYGYTYSTPSSFITQQINQYNYLKENICRNKNVVFHNITSISRMVQERPELIATDGLHPSGTMYQLWVNAIIDDVFEQFLVPEN